MSHVPLLYARAPLSYSVLGLASASQCQGVTADPTAMNVYSSGVKTALQGYLDTMTGRGVTDWFRAVT